MAKKYSDDEVAPIVQMYLGGVPLLEVANHTGKSSGSIIGILQRRGIYNCKNRRWTDDEIQYLKDRYPVAPIDEILTKLGRDIVSVRDKASDLKITRDCYGWSESDVATLEKARKNKSITYLSVLSDKFSKSAIYTKVHKMKMLRKHRWSEREDQIIKDNYEKIPMTDLMALLPYRGRKAIIVRARRFGLIHFKYFTETDVQYIVEHWEHQTDAEMGVYLGRSARTVKWKRNKLGLLREIAMSGFDGVYEYLHTRNKVWRKQSMEAGAYKCALSGLPVEVVHHLFGSNLILDETFDILHLDRRGTIGEYSPSEIESILSTYVSLHEKYPLGVCLTEKIHKLFHKNFGYGNNTPEQFEVFQERYMSGAYNT